MRITVKLKLAAAFGVLVVLMSITAWLGISNMGKIDHNLEELLDVGAPVRGPEERGFVLLGGLQQRIDIGRLAVVAVLQIGANQGVDGAG